MDKKVISPCISICRTDPITGYCYGCARTNEEKKLWKDENIKNEWKEQNLKMIIFKFCSFHSFLVFSSFQNFFSSLVLEQP